MYSNIYMIVNKINDKKYIGQAVNVEFRWKQHIKDSKNKKLKSRYLYAAFNKYGIDNFELKIIEKNVLIENIDEREKYWIKYYNTFAPNGYNLTKGGEGSLGRKQSEETKKKISEKSIKWHQENKELFLEIVKNKSNNNTNSPEVIEDELPENHKCLHCG